MARALIRLLQKAVCREHRYSSKRTPMCLECGLASSQLPLPPDLPAQPRAAPPRRPGTERCRATKPLLSRAE